MQGILQCSFCEHKIDDNKEKYIDIAFHNPFITSTLHKQDNKIACYKCMAQKFNNIY